MSEFTPTTPIQGTPIQNASPQTQPLLQVSDLHCRYGEQRVLEQVSFSLAAGEISCLIGPSGCGKTTLLHTIAGFQPVTTGSVTLEGHEISAPGKVVPPEKRQIGVVFQDYALFPHLSVRDNIAFGLNTSSKTERKVRTSELLQLIRMEALANQFPHQLSGGQQQRVALARALAPRPKLLLMDEPFSNLDTELRRNLAAEVRNILQKENLAALVVTHDREEAFVVGDKLGVLANGHLQQWDSPNTIYHKPRTLEVAKVIDRGSVFDGKITDAGIDCNELGIIPLPIVEAEAEAEKKWTTGQQVKVFLRNSGVSNEQSAESLSASVISKYFLGETTLYRFALESGRELEATLAEPNTLEAGDKLFILPKNPLVFPVERD